MQKSEIKRIIEALLFSARDPLTQAQVNNVFEPDMLFYASVTKEGDRLILAGSRAVAVVAVEESISEAEKVAENEICSITGPLFHRKDIGKESLIQNRINHSKLIIIALINL